MMRRNKQMDTEDPVESENLEEESEIKTPNQTKRPKEDEYNPYIKGEVKILILENCSLLELSNCYVGKRRMATCSMFTL